MADETTETTTTTTETTEATAEATQTETAAPEQGTEQTTSATETADASQETQADEGTLLGGKSEEKGEGEEGGDGKGSESEPEGAPEAYEIALKDADGNDVPLDAEMLEVASEMFREMNLTNGQANKLVPLGHQMMQKGMEAAQAQGDQFLSDMKKQWLEEFTADEEIGGSKKDETLHLAGKGMDALGFKQGHPFRELLNQSGLGNNRDMIATFRTIGKMVGEDSTFPTPEGAGETKKVGWADLYKETE